MRDPVSASNWSVHCLQELEDGFREAAQQVSRALLGDAAASLPAETVQALAALSEAVAALEECSDHLSTSAGAPATQRAWLLVIMDGHAMDSSFALQHHCEVLGDTE